MKTRLPMTLVVILSLSLFSCARCRGDSALEQLSGFDASRIAACYPVTDSAAVAEMAKLIYRVNRLSDESIENRLTDEEPGQASADGEVVEIGGEVSKIRAYRVPEELIEFLGMSEFREVWIKTDSNRVIVHVQQSPQGLRIGDRVSAHAFQIGSAVELGVADENPLPFVARKLSWFPSRPDAVGWSLLGEQGVDLSLLAELPKRNRLSLKADDNALFYSGMNAADNLRQMPAGTLPDAHHIGPIDLLKSPQDFHGEWISLDLKTVRLTRVEVERPSHQESLGQSHYWQVDASGDLGKTVIQLERANGEPIQMSGYYPVTLVTKSLPEFLRAKMTGDTLVAMVDHPVRIEGFFLRLWSYENEFMQQRDAGKQVAPLVIGSLWKSTLVPRRSTGIEMLGYGLAVFVATSILATLWWTRRNAKKDRAAKTISGASTVRIELP